MRTTAMIGAALVAGLVLGFGVSGHAQDAEDPDGFLGTIKARTYTHSFKMPLDVGVDRNWQPPQRIDEERTRVHFPDLYGELINVTPHGDAVVMWFRDDEGVVRNAVIQNVKSTLMHVERAPARHINYSYR